MELGSQFFLKYKDKLAASIRDDCFRESVEFPYVIQEQSGDGRC